MLLRGSWGPSPVSPPAAGSRPVCFWMPPEDAASDHLAAVMLLIGKVTLLLGVVRPIHCVCCLASSHRHYGTCSQDVNAHGSQFDWEALSQNRGVVLLLTLYNFKAASFTPAVSWFVCSCFSLEESGDRKGLGRYGEKLLCI